MRCCPCAVALLLALTWPPAAEPSITEQWAGVMAGAACDDFRRIWSSA